MIPAKKLPVSEYLIEFVKELLDIITVPMSMLRSKLGQRILDVDKGNNIFYPLKYIHFNQVLQDEWIVTTRNYISVDWRSVNKDIYDAKI